MVVGIGVDIVEVKRIERALADGHSMIQRVFTDQEIEYCQARRNQYQHFAGRFAAKEAVLKALGTGWSQGIRWKDVEIVSSDGGRPLLQLHGRALEVLRESGSTRQLLTITHADAYAVAMVVLDS
jgi:holo-[acyl-carrier protein] synthase